MAMRVVWKSVLRIARGPQVVSMPYGSRVLHVGLQHDRSGVGDPTLWYLCDPNTQHSEMRRFEVKPTGGEGYEVDGLQYVGTCIDDNHKLVWHVFEVL